MGKGFRESQDFAQAVMSASMNEHLGTSFRVTIMVH